MVYAINTLNSMSNFPLVSPEIRKQVGRIVVIVSED